MSSAYTLSQLAEIVGEEHVRMLLSSFACSRNLDIQNFVHKNAMDFEKKGIAITYVTFGVDSQSNSSFLQGIFTLALKNIEIECGKLSNTTIKKLQRFGEMNYADNSLSIPAVLIAQLGKNDACPKDAEASGHTLMELAFGRIRTVQALVGGRFVYLECEPIEGLLSFYEGQGFMEFGTRFTEPQDKASDGHKLIRMFRFVK